MPSPIGHMLGGVAAGWLVAGRRPAAPARTRRDRARLVVLEALPFACLGAAPDLDLLVGRHSTYTHSVGAAVLVGVLAWILRRRRGGAGRPPAWHWGCACAAAWGSHVLLDWLGHDTTPPIGIMALWPFSDGFYQSSLFVFDAISRRYWQADFYTRNTLAAVRELAILAPLSALVAVARRRR